MMVFIPIQMSDREEQRKRCSDYTLHDFDIKFLTINPMFSFFHHVSVSYVGNSCAKVYIRAVSYITQVEKTFLISDDSDST